MIFAPQPSCIVNMGEEIVRGKLTNIGRGGSASVRLGFTPSKLILYRNSVASGTTPDSSVSGAEYDPILGLNVIIDTAAGGSRATIRSSTFIVDTIPTGSTQGVFYFILNSTGFTYGIASTGGTANWGYRSIQDIMYLAWK